MTPAEILREARALIDAPEKWETAATGRRHPISAIVFAAGQASARSRMQATWLFAEAATPSVSGDIVGVVARWNNAPERTNAEVMAAFDRAIALAEKEEG